MGGTVDVAPPEHRIPDGPRRELRRGTSGIDLEVGGLEIRAGDLPLFRRSQNGGGLCQCLRVIVRSDDERGAVRVSALDGDAIVDTARLAEVRGEHAVRLFVPEVDEPTPITLEIAVENGPSFRHPLQVRPQRKWRIFLVHHSHLDIGYTDPQGLVLQHHLAYLDSVLDLVAATDSWPESAQFRWNVEATWPLRHWLAARPAALRHGLIQRAHEGRIEICALPFSMHTEAYSVDELARQFVFADELRERYDLEIVTAMQTDVPGAAVGLLNLLADSGVRYLSVAHNWGGRSAPYLNGVQALTRPFWWQTKSGKRILVWYTDSPHGIAYLEGNLVGLADSYEASLELLPEYLAALASRPYPYGQGHPLLGPPADLELTRTPYPHDLLHLRVQGAIADNAPPSIVPAEVVRAWGESWAYPQLRLATNRDFFSSVEESVGDALETHSGDWADWWADGLASAARSIGFNRRAQGAVATAQTLHVLADALGADGGSEPWPEALDRTYESMALFDEHTWGARIPWTDRLSGGESGAIQWQWKSGLAHDAYDRATALLEAARVRAAHAFPKSGETLASVVVFNPSSFPRTDLVRVFLPSTSPPSGQSFALVEEHTGRSVPHAVEPQADPSHRPPGRHLRFVAHDVPPIGYVRYAISDAEKQPEPASGEAALSLENEYYRLEIEPSKGCVAHLVDKELSRDLAAAEAGPFGFNQYVYDRYASAPRLHRDLASLIPGGRWLLGTRSTAGFGLVTERASDAVEERLTLRLATDGAEWLETSFRLVRGVKRVDIQNRLAKTPNAEKESGYFAFPFALREPTVAYEITGGVSGSAEAYVPGSASHVRAVRHWVSLQDAATTVAWGTLEAPLVEIGDIFLPYTPFHGTLDGAGEGVATLFSWVLNNTWDTNFPAEQGGEMVFTYAVSSGSAEVSARQLGMEVAATLARPLVGILAAPGGDRELPARGSYCAVDRDEIQVVTMASSARDHDLVVYLQSYAPEATEVRVTFPDLPVERVFAGTFLERDLRQVRLEGGAARVRIAPGAYVALAIDLDR